MTNAPRIAELDAQIKLVGDALATYKRTVNEGGEGYNPHEDKLMALVRERRDLIEADVAAAQAAIWTREITIARRAEWNAFIRSVATPKGVPAAQVDAREASQGWTRGDLKAAVVRHGL